MVSTPVRREQALFAHGRGVSLERACGLVRVARSSLRYRSRMATKDAPAIAAMLALSARYPRFGYRRIRIYLEREGHAMGMERAHRLWRQAGLQVPCKRPRRKVATTRPRPNAPTGPNQVWAYDFVFDRCANAEIGIAGFAERVELTALAESAGRVRHGDGRAQTVT